MSLVVTGASGALGRLVTAELLAAGRARDLILVTRTPDVLVSAADQGADVRFGDFCQPATLPAAFAGGHRALIISALGPQDPVAAHEAAFAAAARSGVRHVVYTSVQNPVPGNPWPAARLHRLSEQALRASGLPWTVLRNSLYADLRAQIARAYVRAGRWTTNTGDGGHAFVARADCAAAAAAALTGNQPPGQVYDITGPELIDAARYLAFLRGLSGRPVTLDPVGDDAYERYLAAFQADPAHVGLTELFTGTGAAIRTGYLGQLGTGVQQLTGREPAALAVLARSFGDHDDG